MKNEEFDEIIRRKLDSDFFRTPSDAEIGKVMRHVSKRKGFVPRGGKYAWLFFALPAAAMVSYFGYRGIQKAIIRPTQPSAPIHIPVVDSTPTLPADTLQVDSVKASANIAIAQPGDEAINSGKQAANTPIIVPGRTQPKAKASPIGPNKTVQPIAAQAKPANSSLASAAKASPSPAEVPIHTIKNNQPEQAIASQSPQEPGQPEPKHVAALQENLPSTGQQSPSITAIEQSEHTTIADKPASSDDKSAEKTNEGATNHRNRHKWLKDIQLPETGSELKAGPLGSGSPSLYNFGLAGEWLFFRNWGLSAGISYSLLTPEHFQDRPEFEAHHGTHNPPFDPHLYPHEQPVDITLENRLLVIPVSLNRYFPLGKKYALSLSVGTDLDVKLWQNISFSVMGDSLRPPIHNLPTGESPKLINNLVVGLGAERNWKHLGISVEPFFARQLRSTAYRAYLWETGLSLGIVYRFEF